MIVRIGLCVLALSLAGCGAAPPAVVPPDIPPSNVPTNVTCFTFYFDEEYYCGFNPPPGWTLRDNDVIRADGYFSGRWRPFDDSISSFDLFAGSYGDTEEKVISYWGQIAGIWGPIVFNERITVNSGQQAWAISSAQGNDAAFVVVFIFNPRKDGRTYVARGLGLSLEGTLNAEKLVASAKSLCVE